MTANVTSEAIQQPSAVGSPGAVTEELSSARADLPPPEKPPKRPGVRWLDGWFVLGVLLLAAFVGSFPPQNSDLWLHLASGRQILGGGRLTGIDPFSYTAQGTVNHSWLFDSFCYLCYWVAGGAGLVALRVLLLVGLGVLVLFAAGLPAKGRRPIPALCAALMFLTLARWLPLRPELASLFLLGLTLVLLLRLERARASRLLDYLPLFLLFALWANVDSWFVLGPVLLALYAIHQALTRQPGGPSPAVVLLAALAGFASCLLNPSLWHVFELPGAAGPVARCPGHQPGSHRQRPENQPTAARLLPGPVRSGAVGVRLPAACRCRPGVVSALSPDAAVVAVRGLVRADAARPLPDAGRWLLRRGVGAADLRQPSRWPRAGRSSLLALVRQAGACFRAAAPGGGRLARLAAGPALRGTSVDRRALHGREAPGPMAGRPPRR